MEAPRMDLEKKINTVFVSTSDLKGGAAIACYRLFDAFFKNGENAHMLVNEKLSQHPNVSPIRQGFGQKVNEFKALGEYAVFNLFLKNKQIPTTYSTSFFGNDISGRPELEQADIINLHWINLSFLNLQNLERIFELNKPVVWHLQDMWAFTGGCHYTGSCHKFMTECHTCPFLKFKGKHDLSYQTFIKKKKIFSQANLTVVASSRWLAGEASKSKLFEGKTVEAIGIPINTELYRPKDKAALKEKNGLPAGKKHILFGAMNVADHRKGFQYLKTVLMDLAKNDRFTDDTELVVLGKFNPEIFEGIDPKLKIHSLGYVSNQETIADLYALADVFVIPTLEDNLPNTILEALSCGTPVVAFNTGGIPDMVQHNYNGYVAGYCDTEDLKKGIVSVLENKDHIPFAANARNFILEQYSEAVILKKYKSLYHRILQR